MRLAFDIESNGLLDELTVIHMIHMVDLDTRVFTRFDNRTGQDYTEIDLAVGLLQKADVIIPHNGIGFDVPAIQKLYPDFKTTLWHKREEGCPVVWDTLVGSRVLYPDIISFDFSKWRRKGIPSKLKGTHKLEAWGYRIGNYKGDYGKTPDGKPVDGCWSSWNQEMSDYCEQDVRVTANVFMHLKRWQEENEIPDACLEMEMDVSYVVEEQGRNGFYLNVDKCEKLVMELSGRKAELEVELAKCMLPIVKFEKFSPKRNNSKAIWVERVGILNLPVGTELTDLEQRKCYRKVPRVGYVKGTTVWRVKEEPFKPTSRKHIIWNLKNKYGWKPTEFTKGGDPEMSEETMKGLPYPEAPILAEIFMLGKRLGQISDGAKAWLKFVKPETSRVHAYVNTCGCGTARMTHSNPNVSQVPSGKKPFGHECRECWGVPEGKVQVGCDASGIQLRMLAHYLARYDDGEYATHVLSGDIHTFNQEKAGLPTRDMAKTFIYGWLFGAGDEKTGQIVNKGSGAGRKLKEKFMAELPQVKKLMVAVKAKAQSEKSLRGLDGRLIPIRSPHSALNFLLQSAEAITMKKALVIAYCEMKAQGLDFMFIANVHDEVQVEATPDDAEAVGTTIRLAIIEAGEFFNLRIPMDGEFKIGNNWNDCH